MVGASLPACINAYSEVVLTAKDLLAEVCQRKFGRGCPWFPVAFNLVTELPEVSVRGRSDLELFCQMVEYFQSEEAAGKNVHFIVKPWNMGFVEEYAAILA